MDTNTKLTRTSSQQVCNKLGIKAHGKWLQRNIIQNKERIEAVTGEEILIEEIPGKRGKPALTAWFTDGHILYLVSVTQNKAEAKIMKEEIVGKLQILAQNEKAKKSQKLWSKLKSQILTNNTRRPTEVLEPTSEYDEDPFTNYIPDGYTDGFFSPDVVFAEFLETLEGEAGYSLKWDFDISTQYLYQVTAEEFEILKTYEYIAGYEHYNPDGSTHDHFTTMWGQDSLPELPIIHIDTEVPPHGIAWVSEPLGFKKAWRRFVECAIKIVEIYNSPELRAEYGIASHEEQATGWWDGPQENIEPLYELLGAEHKLNDITNTRFSAYGFQVHKDWVEWLYSFDSKAEMARQLHLGSDSPILFNNDNSQTKYINYNYWEAYENGYEWAKTYSEEWEKRGEDNPPPEPPLSPERPLFEKVRIYSDEFRPLFEWYLNNIWLPQYSPKYFQSIDPQGFPQLCEAVKNTYSTSRLPHQFVKAMQPLLIGKK